MENVAEKKRVKDWGRDWRHIVLYILWLFSSDFRLTFFKTYLPESILDYSISIEVIIFVNLIALVIMLDIPFFERILIKPKMFFLGNFILLILLLITNGTIYLVELIPETSRNPLWVIYLILAGIIVLGIVIGFIKRSEQLSK
jgi:hypothetical protein